MTVLFSGLFDDAALFPPGDAPMATAVPAHRHLRAQLGDLVGPFVVPAARLGELAEHVGDGEPVGVSVIAAAGDLPAGAARVDAHPGLVLAAVEVPVATDAATAREAVRVLDGVLPDGVPAAVELPRSAARDEVLDVLAGTGHRAKLRTGGVRAALFPPPEELAATLRACVVRGVALKCTAGLHSAVRHTDPATGFAHHGFLNLLAACDALAAGGPAAAAERWLRQDDAEALVGGWSPDRVARARAVFTSFGTCSVLEPVDDLIALGLLPSLDRTPA
ncbi:hypothetical protein [Geodermatophilus obscurus]|uniref:Transaldolase n=1 Tax=Geodermatophilus obscurus (strain ATCC 25078 / DSM 43160 / JCM 3152 / CCUG 61914 / KCC A-0152 / KCTC 9177 / NBRC 13315 / NRRL B-3577 / G-20) TaxID=526225 RepID=D2SEE8_GEOOG|nr:hypothetical protein [Geodermatophilus obscurus]ADB74620.1 conserved hypothetical protein [Geodermatophilus obscurus DSM 43160]